MLKTRLLLRPPKKAMAERIARQKQEAEERKAKEEAEAMERFARAQMTPEERKKQLEAKLAEKKAELAAQKAAHEEEMKKTMLQMKKDGKTTEEIKAYMLEAKKKFAASAGSGGASNFKTIEELRKRPSDCDQGNLENHLSDADFKKIFKMTKQEWEKAPKWKKESLKKQEGIF